LGQALEAVTSLKVKVGNPQLSVTTGVVHDGVPEHSIVVGDGKAEIVGGVTSSVLVIVWVHVAVFPQPSVA